MVIMINMANDIICRLASELAKLSEISPDEMASLLPEYEQIIHKLIDIRKNKQYCFDKSLQSQFMEIDPADTINYLYKTAYKFMDDIKDKSNVMEEVEFYNMYRMYCTHYGHQVISQHHLIDHLLKTGYIHKRFKPKASSVYTLKFAKTKVIDLTKSNLSKAERVVGDILQQLYPVNTFAKVRPNWLKNPKTGRNLELDFYCHEKSLAIEVDGRQHYMETPHFHPTSDHFRQQEMRDQLKDQLCRLNGVKLIRIPYTITNYDHIVEFIKSECNSK